MSMNYSLLTSVEDLIGRLIVAAERKISQSVEPDMAILSLGFPSPREATNEELSKLQPFYIDLLQNIGELQEESILKRLDSSEDEASLLLYVLEFPLMVLSARKDVSGFSRCDVEEAFEIPLIAARVVLNEILLRWCRKAIANQQNHCVSVVSSAVCLLSSISQASSNGIISVSKAKKQIRSCIFQDDNDEEGFISIRKDLVNVVSRNDAKVQLIANSVLLQQHILVELYGDHDKAMSILVQAGDKQPFGEALNRIKDELGPQLYMNLNVIIYGDEIPLHYRLNVPEPHQLSHKNCDSSNPVYPCGRNGCNNPGKQRCGRCKLVVYCSRECQRAHWTEHKKSCRSKSSVNKSKVKAAETAARLSKSPALIEQDRLLAENPQVNYVIVMPSGKMDVGFALPHPKGKFMFSMYREKAPTMPAAVYQLYKWLVDTHPKLKAIIRKQLTAEYGIDPLSDVAKNGEMS